MENVYLPEYFGDTTGKARFDRYRNLWARTDALECLTSFPLHLDLELSGLCNIRCEHCFQNGMISSPGGLMNDGLFKRIIDEGVPKGLSAIKLQIRGEPLLHPRLLELARYARDKGVMDIQLTTNATLMNEAWRERLLSGCIDGIWFSVDGQHEDSYRDRSGNRDYSEIEEKILDLLRRKAERGLEAPWVKLKVSIPDGEDPVATRQYVERRFPGATLVHVGRYFDFHNERDSYPDLQENYRLQPCPLLFQRLAVFWDGRVTTCCMDYNACFNLGRAGEQSIERIWTSEKMNALRNVHLEGRRSVWPICSHCHVACQPVPAAERTPETSLVHAQKDEAPRAAAGALG